MLTKTAVLSHTYNLQFYSTNCMLKRKETADGHHRCKHPYTSLGIEQIVQLSDDLFVIFRNVRLDPAHYSGLKRVREFTLVHTNVLQRDSMRQCAFCLKDYADQGRWEFIQTRSMHDEAEHRCPEETWAFLVCNDCRMPSCLSDAVAGNSNLLLQYSGECAFYRLDSYHGYNY